MHHACDANTAHAGCISSPRKKPIIVCGDLNVAASALDLARPRENEGSPGYTPQEREKFRELLGAGFADTFRLLHPDRRAYTWWSYRAGARARDIGWRIDYFLVSSFAAGAVRTAEILNEIPGSDHCPVLLDMEL